MLVKFLKAAPVAVDGKGVVIQEFEEGVEADLLDSVAKDCISSGLAKSINAPAKKLAPPVVDSPVVDGSDKPGDFVLAADGKLTEEQHEFLSINAMRDLIEDDKVSKNTGMPDVLHIEEIVRGRLNEKFGPDVVVEYNITAEQRNLLFINKIEIPKE